MSNKKKQEDKNMANIEPEKNLGVKITEEVTGILLSNVTNPSKAFNEILGYFKGLIEKEKINGEKMDKLRKLEPIEFEKNNDVYKPGDKPKNISGARFGRKE